LCVYEYIQFLTMFQYKHRDYAISKLNFHYEFINICNLTKKQVKKLYVQSKNFYDLRKVFIGEYI